MTEQTEGNVRTRDEHLAWCKKRALEYCDNDNPVEAIHSMLSDLTKHSDTVNHGREAAAVLILMVGPNDSSARQWIGGFN